MVSRNRLVGCFQPAVSGVGCPVGVVGGLRLLPKNVDREPACQPAEFGRTLVKLLHDEESFLEQSASREILQAAREIAGDRRKLREHSAAFVSRFAQAPGVLVTQRLLERGKMLRDAR